VFLFWLTGLLRVKSLEREAADLRKLLDAELKDEVFGAYEQAVADARKMPDAGGVSDPKAAFQRTRDHVNAIRNHLKNELGLATEVPPIRSCLETWAATMKAVASVRGKIEYLLVKEEKFYQDKGDLAVIVGELAQGDLLTEHALRKDPLFEKVELRPTSRTKDEKHLIPITFTLVEKTAADAGPAKDGEKEAAREGAARDADKDPPKDAPKDAGKAPDAGAPVAPVAPDAPKSTGGAGGGGGGK